LLDAHAWREAFGARSSPVKSLRELWRRRELLVLLATRDIKVRYKQSVMGVLWALLMPAIVVLAGVVVRLVLTGGQGVSRADLASVLVKSLPWSFFVASLRFATASLVGNRDLVAKLAFPKEVFPLASVVASGFDFVVAAAAAILFLTVLGTGVSSALLWVPVLLVILAAFTIGLCLFLAAANLFFRDVKYIVEVILTFAIFFTPVLYEASMLGAYERIALLNPVAPLLEGMRDAVVLGRAPDLAWLAYSATWALVALVGGYAYFKRSEYLFAEKV
jgi:ABC-type polysaccharide/polyol phosphate export permease